MNILETNAHSESVETHVASQRIVLSVRDLRKAFGGQVVLDGVDTDLREGEIVLLRGDNGSGKTTLLNILTGNLEPDAGTIHLRPNGQEETFQFPRKWWESLNPFDHFTPERVANEAVGRTWQDVRLFPTLTLSENIAVAKQRQAGENPLRVLIPGLSNSKGESSNRLASSTMLADLGLAGREQSSGDKISLGQSKRVAIARAVQAGARILFLDEPLSGLDAAGIEEVLGLLSSLARSERERLTLVIVEHTFNIPRVLEFANTVWTLRAGRIVMQTPAKARADYSAEAGDGAVTLIARHLGNGYQREDIPLYGGACLTRFIPAEASSDRPVLLEVRDLVVRRGSRLVVGQEAASGKVTGISFTLCEGDIAILQAPNGWGKTTLLDAIAGTTQATRGEILLDSQAVHHVPTWSRIQLGLSILSSRNQLFTNLNVSEAQTLCRRNRTDTGVLTNDSAWTHRAIASLSGGERQHISLSLLSAKKVGIYDEPFSALDHSLVVQNLQSIIGFGHRAALILLPHA